LRSCSLAVIVLMPWLLVFAKNQSFGGPFERQAQGGGDACAIGRIGLGAVGDVALLDVPSCPADRASRIVEQSLALSGVHLPEEVPRLLIVIVITGDGRV
jgi:hypothetical protein